MDRRDFQILKFIKLLFLIFELLTVIGTRKIFWSEKLTKIVWNSFQLIMGFRYLTILRFIKIRSYGWVTLKAKFHFQKKNSNLLKTFVQLEMYKFYSPSLDFDKSVLEILELPRFFLKKQLLLDSLCLKWEKCYIELKMIQHSKLN